MPFSRATLPRTPFIYLLVGLLACETALADEPLVPSPSGGIQESEPLAVWSLQPGDQFTVSVNIDRKTNVRSGSRPETTIATNDRYELNYRVIRLLKSRVCEVLVTIQNPGRQVRESGTSDLAKFSSFVRHLDEKIIPLNVAADGIVSLAMVSERKAILSQLTGMDRTASTMFDAVCSPDVMASWAAPPFWCAELRPGQSTAKAVEREFAVSAGKFGVLQTAVRLQPSTEPGTDSAIRVSGSGRFVPLVLPEIRSSEQTTGMTLEDVMLKLESLEGTLHQQPQNQTNGRVGPAFESLDLRFSISGSGRTSGKDLNSSETLEFTQTQVQSWLLIESNAGIRDLPGLPIMLEPQ